MDNVEEYKKELALKTMNELIEMNELILREIVSRKGIDS